MYKRIAFCLFMVIGFLMVNAQTINVRGTVSNSTGKPVTNATVRLAGQGISVTTGATGAYSITRTGVVKFPALAPQTENITFSRGVLELSLGNRARVKVEIFNVKGDLLKREVLQDASAGIYRMNIAENTRASNMLVIHASIGRNAMTFRYLPLNNSNYAVNSSVEKITPVGGRLAKMAAAVDTLKASAVNYLAKALPVSSYDTTVNITLDTAAGGAVTVQLDQTEQTIAGFGINNNWAPAMTDAVATTLFDSTQGLGLSILRVGMGSNGAWFNGSSPQDISKAKARGLKYVIGSIWSPPASCKTNNSENDGGHLLASCYDSWSTTIANFAKNNGIYAMSPQNEPDFASCGMIEPCNGNYPTTLATADEMVAFIKVVGPKLKNAGVKVMAPEASEWLHTWSNNSACCSEPSGKNSSDPLKCGFPGTQCAAGKGYDYGHALYKDTAAWNKIDIIGVHEYDSQHAEPWPSDINGGKPNKEIWQTEMSGVKWWPEQGPSTDINNGVAVAGWIHSALVVGNASAWCYWWYSQSGDNEGLMLGTTDTKRHYTFGNYTKFVRPGMTRVDITGTIPANVLLSAYKGANGTVVVVAINKGTATVTVPITVAGGTAPATFTPWVTSASDNLASKTAVTATGGILNATLAAATVTTFVGK